MKINVSIEDENTGLKKIRIDSKNLDTKIHNHHSGRAFTTDEIKTLNSSDIVKPTAKKPEEKKVDTPAEKPVKKMVDTKDF